MRPICTTLLLGHSHLARHIDKTGFITPILPTLMKADLLAQIEDVFSPALLDGYHPEIGRAHV